jgi:polar amino acid transport system permease protein
LASIQAVPRGQTEAARSLGMSAGWAMISIVLPQAFRIILPPLTNELILLTKDCSASPWRTGSWPSSAATP